MMRAVTFSLVFACIIGFTSAHANFSQSDLNAVSTDAMPNAQLPMEQGFVAENGNSLTLGEALEQRPAVLIFADYACKALCRPILTLAAVSLEKSGLRPGVDFHLIAIGLDPRSGPDIAQEMKKSSVGFGTPLAASTIFLSGDATAIRAVTTAAGYIYSYDAEQSRFAHPAAIFILTPQGRISRVLAGIGLDGSDLRLALLGAGQGRVGSILERIQLLCYGLDPAHEIYTARTLRWLNFAASISALLLTSGIAFLALRGRFRHD